MEQAALCQLQANVASGKLIASGSSIGKYDLGFDSDVFKPCINICLLLSHIVRQIIIF